MRSIFAPFWDLSLADFQCIAVFRTSGFIFQIRMLVDACIEDPKKSILSSFTHPHAIMRFLTIILIFMCIYIAFLFCLVSFLLLYRTMMQL